MSNEVAERPETGVTNMMERLATSPEVDVAKLEKLMDMQERILARDAESAFNAAFAELQSQMPEINEKGQIKHGSQVISRYALFEDINEAVKPILQANGFGVSFRIDVSEANETLVTGILMHRAGHREQTSMRLPADTSGSKNAVQALGSSVSYGKRYVLCALLNITTRGEDNDGAGPTIDDEQRAELDNLLTESKAQRTRFLNYYGVKKLADLPAGKFDEAKAQLQRKLKDASDAKA